MKPNEMPEPQLVEMEKWMERNKPGDIHVVFRFTDQEGNVVTCAERLTHGWYGTIRDFLKTFKKVKS